MLAELSVCNRAARLLSDALANLLALALYQTIIQVSNPGIAISRVRHQ